MNSRRTQKQSDAGTRRILRVSVSPALRVSVLALLVAAGSAAIQFIPSSRAQTRQQPGAHSTVSKDSFTAADRRLVEKAIGTTCAERIRDPLGSTPIDEMQARPSLPVNNPEAVAGARRAENLLPATRRSYPMRSLSWRRSMTCTVQRARGQRISAATQRVEAVRRIKPDVDARD
jgi:hypothetical protein